MLTAKLKSMRGRLLFLLALVIISIALFNQGLTLFSYWSALDDIDDAQHEVARSYAVSVRRSFENAGSTLIAVALRLQAKDGACQVLVQRALKEHESFSAVMARSSLGASCLAASPGEADAATLEEILPQTATSTPVLTRDPTLLTSLDAFIAHDRLWTVLHVSNTAVSGESWSLHALVKVDTILNDQPAGAMPVGNFALIKAGKAIAANGAVPVDWIPKQLPMLANNDVWQSKRADGSRLNYAAAPVARPDMYVLANLDAGPRVDAWHRYLTLSLAPLAFMGLLVSLYTRAIQRDVVASARQIKTFASLPFAVDQPFEIDPAMPEELQSVFQALYDLKTQAATREAALTLSGEKNHALTLELHHRVKNSLQVIQSYISLGKRELSGKSRQTLAQTEARVQVIATAYRLALSEAGMQSVPVRLFATQVTNNIFATLREKHQWVTTSLDVEGDMHIDRLIPLGLAMVEVLGDALAHYEFNNFSVNLISSGADQVDFTITQETEAPPLSHVSTRMMAGLASQLEAQALPVDGKNLLHWRFNVDPQVGKV